MLKYFRKKPLAVRPGNAISTNGFGYVGGGTIVAADSWGKWLQNQPAPKFKPGHQLYLLSIYTANGDQEYEIALDECERWGYALNVHGNQVEGHIADSLLAVPLTTFGKLLKLAKLNPSKYPVTGAINQRYPDAVAQPDGYLHAADGTLLNSIVWSPEATPAAMLAAVDFKLAPLRALAATGVNIQIVYDGGEFGLSPADFRDTYALDPKVLAAKGTKSWFDYLSERQAFTLKAFRDAVNLVVPNRRVYVYYPLVDSPYTNIPGTGDLTYNYGLTRVGTDVPSGSIYFRDYFSLDSGMGNPNVKDRAYSDQLTQYLSAFATQITNYNQPYSYNFLSAGWRHNKGIGSETYFGLPIRTYLGFLKCMYAAGQIGGIASYFSSDCSPLTAVPSGNIYDPYDVNDPPFWLRQQMALSEVHARFTWLDDYIVNGDLLPGKVGSKNVIKPYTTPFEYPSKVYKNGFFYSDSSIRCLVRKSKTLAKWLIVVWVSERCDKADGIATTVSDGASINVYISDIPGLPLLQLVARPEGSIYTVDGTSGNFIINWEDTPAPNALDAPKILNVSMDPTLSKATIELYSIRGLSSDNPLPTSSFSVSGCTVNTATVNPARDGKYYISLGLTNNSLVVGSIATVAYNGIGVVDVETNLLPTITTPVTIFDSIYTTLGTNIYFRNNSYSATGEAAWFLQNMVSTKKAIGDCTVEADLYKGMIALSPESTNVGDYRTWLYCCNTGIVDVNNARPASAISAIYTGTSLVLGTINGLYASFTPGDRTQIKRVGGVVTVSKKSIGETVFTLLGTYPVNSTATLYLHGAFDGRGATVSNVVTTGFA